MNFKKITKFVKKHTTLVVAGLALILVVVGLLILKEAMFPAENKAIYGTRTEGRDKVPINKEKKSKVTENFKDISSSVKVRTQGRIIYIDVKVNGDVSRDTAKDYSNRVLEVFSEEEKKYYDIQILVSNKDNSEQFPIIGYKHHTSEGINWTKDR